MTSDGGGFTLALKANGSNETFGYEKPLWTDSMLLNEASADLSLTEAKLQPFLSMGFTSMRVTMVTGTSRNSILLALTAPSMLSALSSAVPMRTSAGRGAWKGLLPGSSLEANCNEEGLNLGVVATPPIFFARVRIGIVANNEDECLTPDSWLGIGGLGPEGPSVPNGFAPSTVGNRVAFAGDNGEQSIAAFAYVFVR
jgi:hypothetical protein